MIPQAASPEWPSAGSVDERPRARCLVVIGSRRDAVNLFPVIHALRSSPTIDPFVVVAGPHSELIDPVLEMADVVPDADLCGSLAGCSVNRVVANTVTRFDDLLADLRRSPVWPAPAAVLVHGNSTPAMGAALASAGTQLPVVHIETESQAPAGRATEGATLPYDFNRRMLTRLATLSIAPTMADLGRLVSEGRPIDEVFVTGSTAVDAFRWAAARQEDWPDQSLAEATAGDRPIVLVNFRHPGPDGSDVSALAAALVTLASVRQDVTIVVPLHPDPAVRSALLPVTAGLSNVVLTRPLSYPCYARLVARATLAISDSMSQQQEAPSVGTPVLATNARTRHQMGSEAGTTLFVGSDPDVLAREALRLLEDHAGRAQLCRAANPFGDGRASERIVLALEHLLFHGPSPAPFGRKGSQSLPAQRSEPGGPARRAGDPVTHAYAELSALAHRTRGSLQPARRGRQDW